MTGQDARSSLPGDLIGRAPEVAELSRLTGQHRLLTLLGTAGTGKSSLLRGLAAALSAGYPDGAVVVDLADLRQPALVPARVAEALRICEEPGIPVTDTLAAALADRRLLLALDGAEHVAGAGAVLSRRLLASAPGLLVIAASRVALGSAAEHAWPVPPLSLPGPGPCAPPEAARSAAVRLLVARAGPGFALDDSTCALVTSTCAILGGMPLALELAAACLGPAPHAAAVPALEPPVRAPAGTPSRG